MGIHLPHGMRDQHQNTEERSARKTGTLRFWNSGRWWS